jgi:cyclopropane fatty-acyl-phospholipid synthase-like methyltransferase
MNPTEIREVAMAFQKSRIVLTAYELDIFTYIGETSHNSETISKALGLNKNATERLLNALVAIKLLVKNNNNYSNTKDSLMFLSKSSPAYLAGLMHTNQLWNTWSNLTYVVKTGNPAHQTEINERGEEWLEAFINAMHDRGKKQAVVEIAKIDLQGVKSILDIGGGSGCYCMAFLNRKPELKTAIFDLPNVIPISKRIIEKEGFSGKIEHHTGDYTTDDLPKGFDLLFLSSVIHSNSSDTNQELVKKCYNSLNTNGIIVIQDWIMNDAKTEPAQGAIFSVNMLVGVEGGDCYSENEIRTWLKNAGFSEISKVEVESGRGQVTGVKK